MTRGQTVRKQTFFFSDQLGHHIPQICGIPSLSSPYEQETSQKHPVQCSTFSAKYSARIFNAQRSTLKTLPSALNAKHSQWIFNAQHSMLNTLHEHSMLSTLNSTLNAKHSTFNILSYTMFNILQVSAIQDNTQYTELYTQDLLLCKTH